MLMLKNSGQIGLVLDRGMGCHAMSFQEAEHVAADFRGHPAGPRVTRDRPDPHTQTHSTVTLLARLRGLSTSWPRITAAW